MQRFAPVHQFLQMASSLVAMILTLSEILLNTPAKVATTWWVLVLEHVKLVATGQGVLQPVKQV